MQITKMRIPTASEWIQLLEVTDGDDTIMHWREMFSFGRNENPDFGTDRAILGYYEPDYYRCPYTGSDNVNVGFRPAFEAQSFNDLPDGAIVVAGSLFMNGLPLRVPTNPVWNGDIPEFIPDAKLELRPALDGPAYQVRAIKAGNVLIADRVLVASITWPEAVNIN